MDILNGYDETGVGEAVSMPEKRRDVFIGSARIFVNGEEIWTASHFNMKLKAKAESVNGVKVERQMCVDRPNSLSFRMKYRLSTAGELIEKVIEQD